MPYQYSYKKRLLSKILEYFFYLYFIPQKWFKKKNNIVKNILILEPFQMGDIVALTVMFDPLKTLFPESNIYILSKNSNKIVLKYDSRIQEMLTADFSWTDHGKKTNKFSRLKKLYKSLKRIRKNYQFDLGIDPRGDIRSQIILRFLKCKQTLGYTNYINSNLNLNGFLLNTKVKVNTKYLHRYDWNRYLLTGLGLGEEELLPIKMPSYEYKKFNFPKKNQRKVVVHIGSGWEYRRWKNENWAKLLDFLSENKQQIVTVIGGKGEQDVIEEVQKLTSHTEKVNFQITSFDELIYYIQYSDLFIGLDSGPMNLASCLNKKALAIFGPGDSSIWHPYHPESQWIHKKEEYPCNPCLQQVCVFPENSCMQQVHFQEVKGLIIQMLKAH